MARSDEPPPPAVEDKEAASVNLFRNYELRTAFAPPERRRLPTTLVTGWLGSGKTTVMRHVLANRQDLKVACAVNDFAELNIDAELVARETRGTSTSGGDGNVVELTNGCLCCTLGGELETQVWKMLDVAGKAGVADPSAAGPIEYLLIETSGLVDPTETVLALDKTFGKLARVRLDSVVCVVDAESAAAGGALGPEAFAEVAGDARGGEDAADRAWARQLAAADVVLLNKIDLLASGDAACDKTKLEAARAFVRKWAPDARVVETTRGRAPLPSILDVELAPQPEGKFGHDWDSAARPFLLSPTGGGLRKAVPAIEANANAKAKTKSGPFVIDPSGKTRSGVLAHGAGGAREPFGSASFECGAVSLASFQRWVASGIPREAARAKGFVTFLEDPDVTYDFHLSGRRRVEIERAPEKSGGGGRGDANATRRGGKRDEKKTRLVLIGPGVDPAASLDALREMRAESEAHLAACVQTEETNSEGTLKRKAKVAERLRWARALVASDARLELVDAPAEKSFPRAALAECVHFRLTGAALNGMTCESMEREHGVDFNRVNAEFVRALNAAGAGATATTAVVAGRRTYFGSDFVVARVAVGAAEGEGGCLEKWEEVGRVCAAVLQRHIAHIPKCRCGF
jgi:G3E family GTPase